MKNIAVIGTGYVGLVTGTCFADLGNRVSCIDIDEEKIDLLKRGGVPIFEPGLEEVIRRNVAAGRLYFTTSYPEGLADAEFVFIAVGTPSGVDGEADLQYVRMAAETIAETMDHPLVIINKSTVPVGTGDWVADIIRKHQTNPVPFSVVSCPEFLREGSALADFMSPDRVVLGSLDHEAAEKVAQLHLPLRAPIVLTDLRTAEMIKYASNAFLATRISFINEIATICEKLGADVKEVAAGMGYDKRIGRAFLDAGVGYGGSCFEADETVFTLNSPTVATESFRDLFARSGAAFRGDTVEVAAPADKRILAYDLETGRPTLAQVQAVTRRPYRGVMVELSASMGRTLRVTADHPVVLHTDDGASIVPASAVVPGDRLMALCEMPPVEPVTSLDLIALLAGTPLEEDVLVSAANGAFSAQYDRFARHIPQTTLAYPHDIKRYNRMRLSLYRQLSAAGVLDVPAEQCELYTAKGAGARLRAVIPVDAGFMRLLGYYLAEGCITQDTGRAGAVRERVLFSFHEDETEYIADVRRILDGLGLKYIERRSTHAVTTIVSSRIFAWLLRDVLQVGVRSDDKALPHLALNVSEPLRRELLRGAWSGDGAVTTLQGGRNLMFEYATVSKQLADGMALLMQTLDVVPALYTRRMNKSTQAAYILRISGYGQLDALRDLFGEKHRPQIDAVLAGYVRHIRQRGFERRGPFAVLTVQDVRYDEVDTQVYSLETTTGTLVASSGLICHNCFPKDVKALEYMGLLHGAHPALLRAVMDINRDQRRLIVHKLRELLGSLRDRSIGLLGLAFKPNTDDMRDAPAVEIANILLREGALVRAYDPVAMGVAERVAPEIKLTTGPYELAEGSDALVLVTEWNEFKHLDLPRIRSLMRTPVVIDGRNVYEPQMMREAGFLYRGIGRGYNNVGPAEE
ncbi:MAG: UDP-glucose 6-dehydrogenase TuaD [Chloroflexi bacterium ADurb.Bin325]|nr:MAG: UDP-glucose 6-dehydrogenase TuaD [Chloroflexi bacterium ADurb.Bin325]